MYILYTHIGAKISNGSKLRRRKKKRNRYPRWVYNIRNLPPGHDTRRRPDFPSHPSKHEPLIFSATIARGVCIGWTLQARGSDTEIEIRAWLNFFFFSTFYWEEFYDVVINGVDGYWLFVLYLFICLFFLVNRVERWVFGRKYVRFLCLFGYLKFDILMDDHLVRWSAQRSSSWTLLTFTLFTNIYSFAAVSTTAKVYISL